MGVIEMRSGAWRTLTFPSPAAIQPRAWRSRQTRTISLATSWVVMATPGSSSISVVGPSVQAVTNRIEVCGALAHQPFRPPVDAFAGNARKWKDHEVRVERVD